MSERYDVVIVGAGPAGLTAAIYASRANLSVLIIEAGVNGGKLSKTYEIENYPGIKSISGLELANQLTEHGQQFGAKLIAGEVRSIEEGEILKVKLADGTIYEAKAVIIATGTKERTLDLPHADEFTGRGISYCAVCDGFFYRKKQIAIIGGGNSALEEALYLASLAEKVTIIIRRDVFRADASVIDRVKANDKIEIITKHIPKELCIEDDRICGLKIENVDTGEEMIVPCKGIYGAGDCIKKDLRQVVTACNDGAIAANSIIKYLKE